MKLMIFGLAAERVQARYRRRFAGLVAEMRSDITSITNRWYWRGTTHIVRERLGRPHA